MLQINVYMPWLCPTYLYMFVSMIIWHMEYEQFISISVTDILTRGQRTKK